MISEAVLEQGVAKGILSNQQATDLRVLARDMETASVPEPEDDEKLRFITGFSDIFVTMGLALFTGALGYLTHRFASEAMWIVLVVSSWLLAEFFTRRRRMALPSIALLVLYAVSVFGAGNLFFDAIFGASKGFGTSRILASEEPEIVLSAALLTAAMTVAHYWRFRVPITVAAGAAALALAVGSVLAMMIPEWAEEHFNVVIPFLGLAVFALAMRFDLSDPQRVTRRTDIAFWLHLLAAPMIVHPLIAQLSEGAGIGTVAPAVLAVFLALGIVAVVIDRRAILVSGLAYAGYALATLFQKAGFTEYTTPFTLLALGTFVLLLSAGWRPIRAAFLRLLPPDLARRFPHPILSSS